MALSFVRPQSIYGEIGCGLEQKRPQVAHRPRLIEAQQPHVGFLCNFARSLLRAQTGEEKTDQGLIMFTKQSFHERRARTLLLPRRVIWCRCLMLWLLAVHSHPLDGALRRFCNLFLC